MMTMMTITMIIEMITILMMMMMMTTIIEMITTLIMMMMMTIILFHLLFSMYIVFSSTEQMQIQK